VIAGSPDGAVDVPAAVGAVAGRESVRCVWVNEAGGLTYEIGSGHDRRFAKWAPAGSGLDLAREADRLRWAIGYTTVPRVLNLGRDDLGDVLVTAALPGESAVADRWVRQPRRAAAGLGTGLRVLHDRLPVGDCPFSWSVQDRLAQACRPVIGDAPSVDRLVVCQGDACAPNTLLADDGTCTGHVDLGALGVADRWADLAVATWSLEWNYGPGLDDVMLDAYGIGPDPARTAYYRELWDAGP
jgi:kanamycin kinase